MSRIIKEGKLPVMRMKCAVCGCEFEYDKRDMGREMDYSVAQLTYPPQNKESLYVDCPFCHERQYILSPKERGALRHNGYSDFAEDAKALAKQYGYELISIEVK